MADDHHGQTAGMATLLVRPVDEILGTHKGDLDGAVAWAKSAFEFDTKPMADLLRRGKDLDGVLRSTFRQHPLAAEFHEFLASLQTTRQ
jgi:hypothetical protein